MSALQNLTLRERILGGLWGSVVGDALGVPVEFIDRATVQLNPVTSMRDFGTHNQPRGTWSDDSSMILCTTDSLLNYQFNLTDIGDRFVSWLNEGLWTAHGNVFDVGATTAAALRRIAAGVPAEKSGGKSEDNNGNGSLMRILPVALRFSGESTDSFVAKLESVSAITHAHVHARMACVFYGMLIRQIMSGWQPHLALNFARSEFTGWYEKSPNYAPFRKIVEDQLVSLPEYEVYSTGYVFHTLQASLWCLLTTSSFKECVLKTVNLGGDTDTTACVAGGLAGVAYGVNAIPADWLDCLARKNDLADLFQRFATLIEANSKS